MPDRAAPIREFDPLGVQGSAGDPGRRYLLLDVFTDTPMSGNQLAVFTEGSAYTGDAMQAIARELNLSETVFLLPCDGDGHADARARIFTPRVELPFAGHPVLGCAIVVAWALERDEVCVQTPGGEVPLHVTRGESWTAFGRMQQPIPSWEPYGRPEQLLAALGVSASKLPVEVYCNGPRHVYVALEDEDAVAALAPDSAALEALGEIGVSCFAGRARHWKTRMFGPGLGVREDPATGSAAGPLALHLARHGRIGFGDEIEIRQGEELDRSSLLFARASGSEASVERIEVAGSTVLVGAGVLRG